MSLWSPTDGGGGAEGHTKIPPPQYVRTRFQPLGGLAPTPPAPNFSSLGVQTPPQQKNTFWRGGGGMGCPGILCVCVCVCVISPFGHVAVGALCW